MAAGKRKYTPLTRKVNLIIIISLILGIGGVVSFFSLNIIGLISNLTADNLIQQSKFLSESIATVMLNGEAPLAVQYFDRLKRIGTEYSLEESGGRPNNPERRGGYTITLYRVTGERAFSDNSTIASVNGRQKRYSFMPRTDVAAEDYAPTVQPYFSDALQPVPTERIISFEKQKTGSYVFSIYQPLMNKARCWGCHGVDATFRGVIAIESDITASVQSRQTYLIVSIVLFLILVAALTVVLTSFLRRSVIRPVQMIGNVCTNVTNGRFTDRVDIRNRDEIGILGETVNKMVVGLHERFELSKFVSSSTLESLTAKKGGERLALTILFSDIRGFTSYSEGKKPEAVVEALNKILNFQTEIISRNKGDVDKYVGDEIVAFYSGETPELAACRTALAIQSELAAKSASAYHGLQVGIGINSGEVILGLVGSEKRADYTIIGDNVNLASRLCGAAKAGQIIIADSVHEKVKGRATAEGPFRIKLKGKADYVRVYLLKGLKEAAL